MPKVNPYIAGNPVGGEDAFVGRADVLEETLRMLRQPSASALVLYGQRRIGKTSVLLELAAKLPEMGPYMPVYFDLQDKAALPLATVLGQLADEVRDKLPDLGDDDGDLAPYAFRDRFLTAALDHLEDETSLVFLFDEFDVLDEPKESKAGEEFFPFLRNLLTFKPERVRFVFVIGRRTEDLSNLTLSLFKATRTVHVSLLAKPDIEALVRLSERNGSLSWTDAAVEDVCSLAGGHPYLTQQLCQEVWERVSEGSKDNPAEATSEDVATAVEPTLRSATGALEWLWGGLGPAQRVVAAVLAETGTEPITEEEIHRRLQESGVRILIGELRDAPRMLGEWDLIEPAENGFCFRVELLRRWIVSHKPLDRVREEMDRVQPVADSLFQAAYGLYQADDFDQAVPLLRQVISLNPNHIRGQELLAEILLAQGQRAEAREVLETLHEYMPSVARPRLVQVLLQEAQVANTRPEKTGLYRRVLEIEPNQREARQILVRMLLEMAEEAKSEERRKTLYTKVLELEPDELQAKKGITEIRGSELAQLHKKLMQLEEIYRFQDALELGEQIHQEYSDLETELPDLEDLRKKTQLDDLYQQAVGALQEKDRTKARDLLIEVAVLKPEYRETTRLLHEAVHGVKLSLVAMSDEPSQEDVRLRTQKPSKLKQREGQGSSQPEPGAPWVNPKIGMRFRYIPAGTFLMGSPKGETARDNDETLHEVVLTRGFWIGETAVTQKEWQRFTGNNPSRLTDGSVNRPVEHVSWFDAIIFANRLSEEAGAEPCYNIRGGQGILGKDYHCKDVVSKGPACSGYRLPTEAEWEYACRAGTTTPFWTGERLMTDQANYNGNYPYSRSDKGVYRGKTVDVRSFEANPWGLYEVHGNVWEWIEDWYGEYSEKSVDPVGPERGLVRVVRGGSWYSYARGCRAAVRGRDDPGNRSTSVGFRLVSESPFVL